MSNDTIQCELCGLVCKMQIPASHLRTAHNMTTKEYRALGHQTLSPARLEQLRNSPIGRREVKGAAGRVGPDHPNWKGGHIARSGYKVVRKNQGKLFYEHRLVAEQMLGRPLEPDEVVHHIDGNRSNNDPSNLVVMKKRAHDQLKDGVRRHFQTGPETEEAAVALYRLGWPKAKIERALRVHHQTLTRWLSRL